MNWLAAGVSPGLPVNVSGHLGVSLSVWLQIGILVLAGALFAFAGSYVGAIITRRSARHEADRSETTTEARRRADKHDGQQRASRALAAELDHIAGLGGSFRVLDTYVSLPRLVHFGVVPDLPHPIMPVALAAYRSIERFNAVAGVFNARIDSPPSDNPEIAMALDELGAEAVACATAARDSLQHLLADT
jgi:hypothetical protein